LYVTNDVHAFIEVVLDGRLQSFDLGGGGDVSLSYMSLDGTPLSEPQFRFDEARFSWNQSQGHHVTPDVAASLGAPASNASITAPVARSDSSRVEAILKIVRADVKNDIKSVVDVLEVGASLLVESQSCGRDCKLLLNCIAAQSKDWAVLHIESLDAFQHAWDTIVYVEENGTFKLEPREGCVCLVIDYVKIPHSHLVDLQASIDARMSQRHS
jgi:hypothetical protein